MGLRPVSGQDRQDIRRQPLCFRPLEPKLEVGLHIAWKKYQFFSKAAEKFLECLQREIADRREADSPA